MIRVTLRVECKSERKIEIREEMAHTHLGKINLNIKKKIARKWNMKRKNRINLEYFTNIQIHDI